MCCECSSAVVTTEWRLPGCKTAKLGSQLALGPCNYTFVFIHIWNPFDREYQKLSFSMHVLYLSGHTGHLSFFVFPPLGRNKTKTDETRASLSFQHFSSLDEKSAISLFSSLFLTIGALHARVVHSAIAFKPAWTRQAPGFAAHRSKRPRWAPFPPWISTLDILAKSPGWREGSSRHCGLVKGAQ